MSEFSLKKPVGLLVGVVCAAVALSALAAAPLALAAAKPLFFMLGFEVVILVSSIFGILLARGRFADGPGIGLLCVAAIVAVGSLLGNQSAGDRGAASSNLLAGPVIASFPGSQLVGGFTLFLILRLAASAVICAGAAWVVLARRPRESISSLGRGLALAALFLAVLGAAWALRGQAAAMGAIVQTLGGIAVGVIALGLFAASIHFLVRAFEFGRIRESPTPRATKTA